MIGILAGMGPRSTAPFIDLVITECQTQYGAKSDEDYPHMMIYSLPTPFYVDRPIDHTKMKKIIISGLRKLETTGVEIIAMPCNSAHIYYEDLKASLKIPLLNIIIETFSNLKAKHKKVVLLATPSTVDSGLYHAEAKKRGIKIIHVDDLQTKVNHLILEIKSGKPRPKLARKWESLLNECSTNHASAAIVACTELTGFDQKKEGLEIIDSSKSLAMALIRNYHSSRTKRP